MSWEGSVRERLEAERREVVKAFRGEDFLKKRELWEIEEKRL